MQPKTKKIVLIVALVVLFLGFLATVLLILLGVFLWNTQDLSLPKPVQELLPSEALPGASEMVMTVGGQEIDLDEYRYHYQNSLDTLVANQGQEVLSRLEDAGVASELFSMTEEAILERQSWLHLAQVHGIQLSEDQVQSIEGEIAALKASLGEEAFLQTLAESHIKNEALYLRLMTQERLVENAQASLSSLYETGTNESLIEGYITAKQILFSSENVHEADRILEQLHAFQAAGEDMSALFDEMILLYGTDPGMLEHPNGYTFTEGEMIDVFYETAAALEPGEFSELVPSEFGYHIILREPLDMAALEQAGLVENDTAATLEQALAAADITLNIVYEDDYLTITPSMMQLSQV